MFLNKNWAHIGSKLELAESISVITGIPIKVLQGSSPLHFNVAQRVSWAADREITRSEDIAFYLLGLFDVQMVPLYVEGRKKAFLRLQEEFWNIGRTTQFSYGRAFTRTLASWFVGNVSEAILYT